MDDFPHCRFCGCTTLAPGSTEEICSHVCYGGDRWRSYAKSKKLSIEDIELAEDDFRCNRCSGLFAMEHRDENWFWTAACKFCTKHYDPPSAEDLMKG